MSVVKRIAIDGTTYDIEPTVIDATPTAGSNNTVSSSGVKSYVDSNYVPLSATQAPVTGLTDILTPVNLLPNSDFSIPNNLLPETYPKQISPGEYQICDSYSYTLHNADGSTASAYINNVTVSKNSIRIVGHLIQNNTNTQNAVWSLRIGLHNNGSGPTVTMMPDNVFTIAGTITDNLGTLNQSKAQFSGSSSETYYQKTLGAGESGESVCIAKCLGYSSIPAFYFYMNDNTDFDITISDFRYYYGSFINPPKSLGIDRLFSTAGIKSYLDDSLIYVSSNTPAIHHYIRAFDYGTIGYAKLFPYPKIGSISGTIINDAVFNIFLNAETRGKIIKCKLCRLYNTNGQVSDVSIDTYASFTGSGSHESYTNNFKTFIHYYEQSSRPSSIVITNQDIYKGNNYIPITYSLEHDTGYYSNIYCTIDLTNAPLASITGFIIQGKIEFLRLYNYGHGNATLDMQDITPAS